MKLKSGIEYEDLKLGDGKVAKQGKRVLYSVTTRQLALAMVMGSHSGNKMVQQFMGCTMCQVLGHDQHSTSQ